MNDNITAVLIAIPISMVGVGFIFARQLRAFENVPVFSMLFVRRRWLMSLIIGLFISLLFTVILTFGEGFTRQVFLSFVGNFLLGACCYYLGASLGWGKSTPSKDSISGVTARVDVDGVFPENIQVESSLGLVKVTINSKKRWGFFTMEVFQLIFLGLCALPFLSILAFSVLQNYLPGYLSIPIWLVMGGWAIYIFYNKCLEAIEYIFDKEIIEFTNLSVRIEKFGSRFSSKKEYPAENIKKITGLFLFGGTNTVIKRSPFVNSGMPAFMMWHHRGLKRYRTFGRSIDFVDAQKILVMVYARFPQYQG